MEPVPWQTAAPALIAGLLIGTVHAAALPPATKTTNVMPMTSSAATCPDIREDPQLTLARYIERSLCANLDTRAAWQRVQTQRAQVGAAKADYYPSLSASASSSNNAVIDTTTTARDSTIGTTTRINNDGGDAPDTTTSESTTTSSSTTTSTSYNEDEEKGVLLKKSDLHVEIR